MTNDFISANSFVHLPPVLMEIPSLRKVNARKNFLAGKKVVPFTEKCHHFHKLIGIGAVGVG